MEEDVRILTPAGAIEAATATDLQLARASEIQRPTMPPPMIRHECRYAGSSKWNQAQSGSYLRIADATRAVGRETRVNRQDLTKKVKTIGTSVVASCLP